MVPNQARLWACQQIAQLAESPLRLLHQGRHQGLAAVQSTGFGVGFHLVAEVA